MKPQREALPSLHTLAPVSAIGFTCSDLWRVAFLWPMDSITQFLAHQHSAWPQLWVLQHSTACVLCSLLHLAELLLPHGWVCMESWKALAQDSSLKAADHAKEVL
jgi:hypothetical protein